MQVAERVFARLSEVEKITIRGATDGRLEHIGETSFRSDLPLLSQDERHLVMREVRALCSLEFATKSGDAGFTGATWKF